MNVKNVPELSATLWDLFKTRTSPGESWLSHAIAMIAANAGNPCLIDSFTSLTASPSAQVALRRSVNSLNTRIDQVNDSQTKETSEKARVLHTKIDDVKATYVRRDDLANHISHLEKSVAGMVAEQQRTNDRIDKILAAVISDK